MSRLNLLLLVLVAVCFGNGDAHSRLTVRRAGDQQRQLVGQVMRHGSLVFRVESFDGFLRTVPQLTTDKLLGKGAFGAAYSAKVLADDNTRGLKKDDVIVIKAGCSCPGKVDLAWEYTFHHDAATHCPAATPKLYGGLVTLTSQDPENLRKLKSCKETGCTQQLLFMEKMDGVLKVKSDAIKALTQDKKKFLGDFVLPLLSGLKCIHDANIFHHDIKDENILHHVENGVVKYKFADFGVSMRLNTPTQSNDMPADFKEFEYVHGTQIFTSALALEMVSSSSYLFEEDPLHPQPKVLPMAGDELRRHIDSAALAFFIRMAYMQDSSMRTKCFLSFRSCVERVGAVMGQWKNRYTYLTNHKMVPAGVQIPVLEKVLDGLMTNDITLPKAVEMIKEDLASKSITLGGKEIQISNKALSPDDGAKLMNNLGKRLEVINKNKLQNKDNLKTNVAKKN